MRRERPGMTQPLSASHRARRIRPAIRGAYWRFFGAYANQTRAMKKILFWRECELAVAERTWCAHERCLRQFSSARGRGQIELPRREPIDKTTTIQHSFWL